VAWEAHSSSSRVHAGHEAATAGDVTVSTAARPAATAAAVAVLASVSAAAAAGVALLVVTATTALAVARVVATVSPVVAQHAQEEVVQSPPQSQKSAACRPAQKTGVSDRTRSADTDCRNDGGDGGDGGLDSEDEIFERCVLITRPGQSVRRRRWRRWRRRRAGRGRGRREGGGGEGAKDDAAARSTGSHCGGQAKVRQYSLVGQVLEPAGLTSRSTSVNLLGTLVFGTCGLLLLVVNGQSLLEQQPNRFEPNPFPRRARAAEYSAVLLLLLLLCDFGRWVAAASSYNP